MSEQRAICGEHCQAAAPGCWYDPYIPSWVGLDKELCIHYFNDIYRSIAEAQKLA